MQGAACLCARGNFSEALQLVEPLTQRRVGMTRDERAVALALAARCLFGMNRLADAEAYWRLAIKERPNFVEALGDLGVVLKALNRWPEAEASFRQAIIISPTNVEAHYNLGLLLHGLGHLSEAEASYRDAVAIRPDLAVAHNNLGVVLNSLGRNKEAEVAYHRALTFYPTYAEAHGNLGNLLLELKRLPEAEVACRKAISIRPDYAEAHNNLGYALIELRRFPEAETACRRALAVRPHYAEALNNLGIALHRLERPQEAEAAYRQALGNRPEFAEAYDNLAQVLADLGRLTEAEVACRQAIAVRPGYAEAHHRLGVKLHRLRYLDAAEAAFRQALSIRPGYASAKFGLGVLLLSLGRFVEGWQLYESRYDEGIAARTSFVPDAACAQWRGEVLEGRSLLVWHEQGYGDMIQFGRYLHQLRAQGVRHITLVCRPALHRLFENVDCIDLVATPEKALAQTGYDFWTFLLSVPFHLATVPESIPGACYLSPRPELLEKWRPRLQSLTGYKIGLVWKGSPCHANDQNRSLPSLSTLAPLWKLKSANFVSLQKGEGEIQAKLSPASQPILNLGSEVQDFADSAAIVAQLDLVICVDTAIAHLAGAVGKRCWVLLPADDTEWRWMPGCTGPVWYPATTRLFRQATNGNWRSVIEQVQEEFSREFTN